jgi:hypothetical protein
MCRESNNGRIFMATSEVINNQLIVPAARIADLVAVLGREE